MFSRTALAAGWLALCLGGPVWAQSVKPFTDSTDVLVLDHDFGSGGEIVRVFLSDMQVYRAELSSEDVTLVVRARFSGMKQLRLYPIIDPRSASGSSVLEIYPDQDGEYEIWAYSIQGSRISTRLRLYRDVSESRRRVAAVGKQGWELGVELGGGWHSRFAQTSVASPIPGPAPHAGTDLEACLSARTAPQLPRFGLCVLGVSHQSQSGAPSLLWVYTEPRLGIVRTDPQGYSSWETGVLFRFAAGINYATPTPRLYAPGVFLARHIRTDRKGSGWTVQLSYAHAFYKNFSKPTAVGESVTPRSHRVLFAVGWYK